MSKVLSAGFNSGSVSAGGWVSYEYPSNNPSAMSISTAQALEGTGSNRVELNSTDSPAQFGNTRVELTHNNSSNPNTSLRWWAWSWYFPSATMPSDSRECVIAQWHDKHPTNACSTSPPLAIEAKNDRFRAMIRYNTTTPDYCSNTGATVLQIFDLMAIPKDQWIHVVVNYDPKVTTDGKVQIWINTASQPNNSVLDYNGRCFMNGSLFPYYKLGIYKWLWDGSAVVSPSSMVLHQDRVLIGDTAESYNTMVYVPAGTNIPPLVSAGNPQVLVSTTTTAAITATASDPDGAIVSTLWTVVSGPNTPTIVSASSLNTNITGLIPGLYTFRITATDNLGATSSATTTVRVNLLPIIDLSGNTNYFPTDTTQIFLVSIYTDTDGTVISTQWVQVDGPPTTIMTPSNQNTFVSGLTNGNSYTYTLTAFDNNGEFSTAEVQVQVALDNRLRINRRVL